MTIIHYAVQTCDVSNRAVDTRYCGESRSEITQKCVTSLLKSIAHVATQVAYSKHRIMIFDDRSTPETVSYLHHLCKHFTKENVTVEFTQIPNSGLFNSVRACYNWLELKGADLVYQVQDDYLFEPTAIYDMIDMFMQMYRDTGSHIVVSPYNHPHYWQEAYKYRATPRVLVAGAKQYWVQLYEIPCTFLTSKHEFSKHWDLYENFFNGDLHDDHLEINSFNKIITERGVLCLEPITSVALHMQAEFDKDPYIDWKSRWDSVVKITPS